MAEESAASEITSSAAKGLQQKFFGVPFWIYGVGFVAGFYIWNRYRSRPADTPDANAGDTLDMNPGFANPSPTYGPTYPNQPGTTPDPSADDVNKWINDGVNFLVTQGYDAATADAALRVYASGKQPTAAQWRLVSLVIAQFGTPQGITAPSVPGGGPGMSYDVPNTIQLSWASPIPTTIPSHATVTIMWRDNYGTPITGTLQRMAFDYMTQTYWRGPIVKVTNGVVNVGLDFKAPTPTGKPGRIMFRTTPTEVKYRAAASNELRYTLTAPAAKPKPPAPKPKPPAPKPPPKPPVGVPGGSHGATQPHF